jgi:transcription initiation factor TFIIIB Brf1 subunit/transcription initiation factor TFIIB
MRAMNAAAKTVKDTLRTTAYGPKIAEHNGGIEALVDVFLDRLRLPPDDRRALWRYTTKTLREVEYLFDSGRKPRTIVGGIIYVAAANLHLDIPKKNIMEAAGVCAQTLDKITSSMMTAAA